VAVDDTLFKRPGKKVWAASWFHDESAQGPAKTGYGNNWVVLGVVVRLPVMSRLVMAKLVIKGSNSKSRPWLARRLAERLRRVIIAAKFTASHPNHPTPEEIHVLRLAWEDAAA
jgi:hypothetical protein